MTDDTQPMNREQRRKQKFSRKPSARQDNLRTQRQNATGFLTDEPEPPPVDTAAPDQATTENEKLTTGPGSGGATESADGPKQHEGIHGGIQGNR